MKKTPIKALKIRLLSLLLTLVLLLPVIPIPGASAATLNVTLYGANGGDANDDKTAIQNAINAAAAGDTVYFPAGTYYISNSLIGKSNVKLQGEARNTTIIKAMTGGGSLFAGLKSAATMLNLNSASYVEVFELTFDASSNNSVTAAIWGEPGIGHKLHHNKVKDITQSTGFGPWGFIVSTTPDVEITDNEFTNIGVNSIWGGAIRAGWGSTGAKILRNTITNTGRGGIFLNDGSSHAVIRGNVITGSAIALTGLGFGIEVHTNCDYTIVEDNIMDHWLSVVASHHTATRRNTVSTYNGTFKSYGLEVMSAQSVVTDNLVDGGQHNGMSMSPANGQQLWAYNTINNVIQWGVQIQGGGSASLSQYLYFYKNIWQNTDKDNPIAVYPGTAGNAIRINGGTVDTTFDSNQLINNEKQGIQITGGAGTDRISFVNNTITGNLGLSTDQYPASALDLEWSGNTVSGNGTNTQLISRGFSNPKPVANFTANTIVNLGQPITFTNTSTDAGGTIVNNLWDFGEGVPSSDVSPTYTYQKAGTYKVFLMVTDNGGRMHLKEGAVVVNAGPPDTQAPTTPGTLTSPSKTDTVVNLSWGASTDNVGVTGYNVYKGGVLAGSTVGAGSTSFAATNLTASTAYSFTVKAADGSGNLSAASNAVSVTTNPPDTQAPTAPANLISSYKTDTTASLSWSASTDNVGVTGYNVYKDGVLTGSTLGVNGTTLLVTGLSAGGAYSFTVKAKDVVGNLSAASNAISVTTYTAAQMTYVSNLTWVSATAGFGPVRKDLSSSGAGIQLAGVGYSKGIGTHAASDIIYNLNGAYSRLISDVGVDDAVTHANASIVFQVWADGVQIYDSGVMAAASATQKVDVSVAGVTQLKLTVTDSGNGNSYDHADWAGARFTPSGVGGDTIAPSAPTGLASPSKTATSVSLSWTASTDNVAVTGYDIYRGGTTLCGTSVTTSFTCTGLTANTAYSFTVKAKDAAGNASTASSALSVTTNAAAGDTTAPTVPTGLAAPSKTATSVSLSWTASTDNVAVTGYDIYRGGTTLCGTSVTTSFTCTGLTANTAYSFTVKAKDAAGNVSAASSALSVTTNAATDTQVPSVPSALKNTDKRSTSVSLSWTASTDNNSVTGYDIYRGGTTLCGTSVTTSFTCTGLTASTAYSFTVKAKDAAGNVSNASSALSVTTNAANGTGSINREFWAAISGALVSSIPVGTAPASSSVMTSLKGPINDAESYGVRIRGYIVPTVSGSYTFSVAGDNAAELWLSTDSTPANKVKIGYLINFSNIDSWSQFPTQTSGTITLTAGQQYYVEVLHKEEYGGDHISVGWTGPGIATRVVVPAANIAPY